MPGQRGKGRGGYQRPKNPAPVSGPGALSARTDGGAAKPPLPTGQPYGQRQALEQFQASGPMTPPPSPPVGGGAPPAPAGAPPTGNPLDAFAPTQRPNEPITAGIPMGAGPSGPMLPEDPALQWRALYTRAVEEGWPGADALRRAVERIERR